jgi:hypothetical protein
LASTPALVHSQEEEEEEEERDKEGRGTGLRLSPLQLLVRGASPHACVDVCRHL